VSDTEFVKLVVRMREAQRKYFRTRAQGDLNDSKNLERQVDRAADELTRQPTLFDGLGET
jgi:hypothetical protein